MFGKMYTFHKVQRLLLIIRMCWALLIHNEDSSFIFRDIPFVNDSKLVTGTIPPWVLARFVKKIGSIFASKRRHSSEKAMCLCTCLDEIRRVCVETAHLYEQMVDKDGLKFGKLISIVLKPVFTGMDRNEIHDLFEQTGHFSELFGEKLPVELVELLEDNFKNSSSNEVVLSSSLLTKIDFWIFSGPATLLNTRTSSDLFVEGHDSGRTVYLSTKTFVQRVLFLTMLSYYGTVDYVNVVATTDVGAYAKRITYGPDDAYRIRVLAYRELQKLCRQFYGGCVDAFDKYSMSEMIEIAFLYTNPYELLQVYESTDSFGLFELTPATRVHLVGTMISAIENKDKDLASSLPEYKIVKRSELGLTGKYRRLMAYRSACSDYSVVHENEFSLGRLEYTLDHSGNFVDLRKGSTSTDMFLPRQVDGEVAYKILDRFVQWGGNFIDTADFYAAGNSEKLIGNWLSKQNRGDFIIATKLGVNLDDKKQNKRGLSRLHMMEAVDASLTRLQTDYIDLYQTHYWDTCTPIEDTMMALHDLLRCGKIRYIGISNVTGWQMQKIVDVAKTLGIPQCISLQQHYSLLSRESEVEAFEVCKKEGIAVLPWSPLKGGLLTGKYRRGETPDSETTRIGFGHKINLSMEALPSWVKSTDNEFVWNVIGKLENIANKKGKTVAQVALRWLLQKQLVPSVIIGVTSLKQFEENMGAANGWVLTEDEMKELDGVSTIEPGYPYEFITRLNDGRINPFL